MAAINSMTLETTQQRAQADLALLRQFIDTGDPAVFAEIVQRYARVVYAASLRVLGDEGRAQDVSQETFFRLMQRPRLVTHSLGGWLHRTATHLALDIRRGEKSRKQRELLYVLDQQQSQATEPTWEEVSPYVDEALNDIPEPTRGLLIRHFLQGIAQADLAAEMEVSTATLSRRIKSGLEMLQQNLRKRGVYLRLAVLMAMCAHKTKAAIPARLVVEMGKMNLVGSLRHHLPTTPAPPGAPYPQPFPMRSRINDFSPHAFVWSAAALGVVVFVYLMMVASSWNWSSQPPSVHHEPPRVSNDR
jgi:RNA polymerase sigma-70 factor (ECF subfamily)